jgi:hypothetical protein
VTIPELKRKTCGWFIVPVSSIAAGEFLYMSPESLKMFRSEIMGL